MVVFVQALDEELALLCFLQSMPKHAESIYSYNFIHIDALWLYPLSRTPVQVLSTSISERHIDVRHAANFSLIEANVLR